jgi:arylsulfatase A-like enzyme/Flp pilus assembly protein TadD
MTSCGKHSALNETGVDGPSLIRGTAFRPGWRRGVSAVRDTVTLSGTARVLSFLILFLAPASILAATAPARKPAPNVILITIDTVRADRLGCYGAKNIQTPTLDALGRDGIVFERAISQVPLTWPSHAAILTGLYPFQNGVQDFTGQPLDARFRSVTQAFKAHGYATGAVVSAFVLDRSWGLARGFDFYDDAFPAEAFAHRDLGLVDRRAGESVDHALSWLKKNPHRPFFFWLHLYDPHSPYDPPEPYRSQYQGHLYDGEIAYADHELGRLITWLKRNQLYDPSLIVFLSDHGESLGEHGEHEHGFFVYNATVHIPLIVKLPAGSGVRPGRVSRPVETTAVAPTLMRAAGIHDAMEQQFSSQRLLQNDAPLDDAAYSETFYPFSSFGWSPLHALETSRFHYIDAPQPELYDVIADPEETTNLAAQQTATLAVLKNKLQALLRSRPYAPVVDSSSGLSPDALDKLRALGYVAYRSPVSADVLAAGLADPKNKLGEFNSILEAEDALQAGNVKRAEDILSPVQQQDPKMYVIPFLLGETALRNQDWGRAAEQLQRCMDLNPSFDNAMTGLARALAKLGRLDEAKNWLKRAAASNPNNYRAWYELGLLQAESDPVAAQASYEKAVTIQPNFSVSQRELGLLLFNQKSYAAAVPRFEKAIALGLNDAPLYNFLGICYNQTHQLQKSIRSHQAALKLEPKLAEAHLNLAYDYQLLNQPKAAREEYQQACNLEQKLCKFVPRQ